MEVSTRCELIFWRDAPVDVERGSFEYISEKWGNKVMFICHSDYSIERKKCQWSADNLNQIILEHQADPIKFVEELFKKHPNAIHIFNGFRGKTKFVLNKYVKKNKIKFCVLAERPSYFSDSKLKNYALYLLYRYYRYKYGNKLSVFLTLGEKGIKTYSDLGFDKEKLFPYMYNPYIDENDNIQNLKFDPTEIKLLYIGRFSNFKGVDVLLKSISMLHLKNWKLDFVGGYGSLKEEVLKMAKKTPNIYYKGIWNAKDVISKMREYDLCIVPSKYDGWNLIANEAINAGLGVIITNQATSDELIKASGAGIVVEADDVAALTKSILSVLENPHLIPGFKKKSNDYAWRISSEVVGQYFIDIMDYTFYHKSKRPICPWL